MSLVCFGRNNLRYIVIYSSSVESGPSKSNVHYKRLRFLYAIVDIHMDRLMRDRRISRSKSAVSTLQSGTSNRYSPSYIQMGRINMQLEVVWTLLNESESRCERNKLLLWKYSVWTWNPEHVSWIIFHFISYFNKGSHKRYGNVLASLSTQLLILSQLVIYFKWIHLIFIECRHELF
jgi:hypothetical protein